MVSRCFSVLSQLREVAEADPYLFFNTDLKRELSEEQVYHRSLSEYLQFHNSDRNCREHMES